MWNMGVSMTMFNFKYWNFCLLYETFYLLRHLNVLRASRSQNALVCHLSDPENREVIIK